MINDRKQTHGILCVVSWGVLFPLGQIFARYLKTFKSADPAWFYLHISCQMLGYAIGVAGWATGLVLGNKSKGIVHTNHRNIDITLFTFCTLQHKRRRRVEEGKDEDGFWFAEDLQSADLSSICQPTEKENMEHFTLADLWNQYEEWSVYGVGVPIILPDDETTDQYYVPYLSAIQLYTRKSLAFSRIFPQDNQCECSSDDNESDTMSKSSDASSDGSVITHENLFPRKNTFGQMYAQYIEYGSPYRRPPLVDKVKELARRFPGLLSLKSEELSPASWFSVAWYPIYHIPACANVEDLSACFLTYHTISTLSEVNMCLDLKVNNFSIVRNDAKSVYDTVSEFEKLENSIESDDEKDLYSVIGRINKPVKKNGRNAIALSPFGLSTYKMQEDLWKDPKSFDNETLNALYNEAYYWLTQLGFPMEGTSQNYLKGVTTTKDIPTSQPILLSPTELVESSMPMKVKRKTHSTKHLWTKQEDAALVDCLVELSKDLALKSENGFRTGYLLHLEKLMAAKLPSSNLKATPHIESRYKLLKRQFHAINEMINHSSGFEWNDVLKYRATGAGAETLADAVEEINLCNEETDTFECEIDEHAVFHNDEEYVGEEPKKSEMETQDSVCPSNKKATARKKKRKSDDVLGDLVGESSKYVTVIIEANEEMKGISTYFKKQTENRSDVIELFHFHFRNSLLTSKKSLQLHNATQADEEESHSFALIRVPPTRAKSPKLTRRKSYNDATPAEGLNCARTCGQYRHHCANVDTEEMKKNVKGRENIKCRLTVIDQTTAAADMLQT
ncbi:hypothetical protein ZIOFF_024990 [Zingiber officinale]|uniref:Cytochrome b561 domain-containing protein n=1 Tax=Zingiber officinale TaxID=94328 RepID=A0A8J5LGM3_ZINOF|nr:hypothetical protein ZIOFF_024990 [Zingiber officinale]